MPRLYFDAFINGLVPIKYIGIGKNHFGEPDEHLHEVEILEDKGAYKRGERIYTTRLSIVIKSRRTQFYQLVRTASLKDLADDLAKR